MDVLRLRREVAAAQNQFSNVELHVNSMSELFVKVALQTSVGSIYVLAVLFDEYPFQMPKVLVLSPALNPRPPHRYGEKQICFLHPTMWNPGIHDLTFVIARASKWLNKYEIWKRTGAWPGAEIRH